MAVLFLVGKDLLVLRRSLLLTAALCVYPILIAGLLGLAAAYAGSKPKVAFVDKDGLPPSLVLAGRRFDIASEIARAAKSVTLVPLSEEEARRRLRDGRVVAVLTVPPGFTQILRGLIFSPTLELQVGRGALAARVRQQLQAVVYSLNRALQQAFIASDLVYVRLLREGGRGRALGKEFSIIGLAGVERLLDEMPPSPQREAIRDFLGDARAALDFTDDAIRATANPVRLRELPERGRTWFLSAQVQAYALAMTVVFLGLLLAAAALAAERDENVIGRLVRGPVRYGQLLAAKVALAAIVALPLGLLLAGAFGAVIEAGAVSGGQPWERIPLLAVGLLLVGGAVGALGGLLGGLARETRTAALVAVLVTLPIVFVGVVPREVAPPAGWVSDAFPFAHAVRFFTAALFEVSPWGGLLREAAWLVALGLVYGVAARLAAPRLSV
jgi:ABC-2 type transport system permease protein